MENEIFSIVVKGHPSLIGKANGILKILFNQNVVSKEDLDVLWD